jgi:hypothetical protein
MDQRKTNMNIYLLTYLLRLEKDTMKPAWSTWSSWSTVRLLGSSSKGDRE